MVALIFPMFIQGIVPHVAKAAFVPCSKITDPASIKGYIVTILEENISSAAEDKNTTLTENVVSCYRVNKQNPKDNSFTSTYEDNCPPDQPGTPVVCQKVQVYYAQSGTELLYTYVGRIYRWAAGTIGIVTVLFLIVGGIEMSTAGGDSGRIEKAKERITQSLAGLVILFLSALILYTINPNFFTIS